ncbi:MAG: ATP-binding protein [Candidatus Magnetomorum sp.]|nr:ATP-binding protein [Candidatus Magnetomorum sp.]
MQTSKLLEILSNYNRFWNKEDIDSGIERDILEDVLRQVESKEIIVLKGVRRSGKSTIMAQIIKYLLDSDILATQILRVNFEEPLFSPEYSLDLLEYIYNVYREHIQADKKCFLFLDEIQNIPEWERWVRGRSETENLKIFVTGSSSQMLSREIGTKLTGRHISFEIFPLSFKEFLRFKNIWVQNKFEYLNQKHLIRKMFIDYMAYGGFPEVVLKKQDIDKKLLLKNYFEDIVYRDIAARYQIRDTTNLVNIAVYLLTNMANMTSINKLKKNFSISQDKTENYVSAILESYLIFQLKKFSFSLKTTQRSGFKSYAIDTGLRNRIAFSFSEDKGRLVENLIFCHLKHFYEEFFFHSNGGEIDFIVKEGVNITKYIQVWYDDPGVNRIPDRELKNFKNVMDDSSKNEYVLITNDYEEKLTMGSLQIKCIPAVRYLLFNQA